MAGKPYIPLYIGDWKKDPNVQLLTLEEKGAWVELIFWMHERGEKGQLSIRGIPLSMIHISKILDCDITKAEEILSNLIATDTAGFDEGTGIVYNRRMKREAEISEARARAGRKGGLSKGKQKESNAESESKQSGESDSDIDNETDSSSEKKKKDYSEEFIIAWGIYPSRGGHSNPKRTAYDKWYRLLKQGITSTQLIQAVKAYTRECHNNHKYGTEGVMQAQTFFGPNGRWEEYYEKYQKKEVQGHSVTEETEPVPELTDEEKAENLDIIKKAKEGLEHRHEKSNNDNKGEG